MVDFVLGAALVALFVRGWMRGFVKEAIGLAVLIAGTVIAFRLSGAAGEVVSGMAGTSPDTSRVIGGIALFLLVSIGAAIAVRFLHRGIDFLPGFPTLNRVAGAALAVAGGALVATVILSVLAVAPVPASIGDSIDESTLAVQLTDPDGLPVRALGVAGGDDVLAGVLRLDALTGSTHVDDPGDRLVALEVEADAELTLRRGMAASVLDLVNEQRVRLGADPVTRSAAVDAVAAAHAEAMYSGRWMAHRDPVGDTPGDRLTDAGVLYVSAGELIGLGSTPAAVVARWGTGKRSAATLADPSFRRAGTAVVDGPLGVLVTVVFTG